MKLAFSKVQGSTLCRVVLLCVSGCLAANAAFAQHSDCLDGFCIGQSIQDHRFDTIEWLLPKNSVSKERCVGIACQPQNAFRGYTPTAQAQLALAVSWRYGLRGQTPIFKEDLPALRSYKYECNQPASAITGERRFFGVYRSIPSGYTTVIGLRLIDGDLKIYRISREYPFHNQGELLSLVTELKPQYGDSILYYNYLSSNAYSDVISQRKAGWFARSSLFNTNDPFDNTAELVLIDPQTRELLEPSSMLESGEISAVKAVVPPQCSRPLPLQ
jgi:hypothetical protein